MQSEAKAQYALQQLHANGSIPRNFTLPRLTNCLMGRLNAANYPYRPTVSILLQYFKRPWIIDKMVCVTEHHICSHGHMYLYCHAMLVSICMVSICMACCMHVCMCGSWPHHVMLK